MLYVYVLSELSEVSSDWEVSLERPYIKYIYICLANPQLFYICIQVGISLQVWNNQDNVRVVTFYHNFSTKLTNSFLTATIGLWVM